MGKKKYYLTLDTETATLPFANDIAKNAKQKQAIAIAKPLVYDIGWVVTDTKGNTIIAKNYLVQETFFVPNVFNTAYYCNKRPIYMKLLTEGLITAKCWNDIMAELLADLQTVDMTTAYNACFDFKKAIPFTERYIKHLYSEDYNEWEKKQRKRCESIAKDSKSTGENPDYLKPFFELRGFKFPVVDLWGLSCDRLINIEKYKKYCMEYKLLTNSALYFKTSAETSYQYLFDKYDFIEDHTALSDALIEAQILTKALKKGKIKEAEIKEFPFRELGTTYDWVLKFKSQKKWKDMLVNEIETYYNDYCLSHEENMWTRRLENILDKLDRVVVE